MNERSTDQVATLLVGLGDFAARALELARREMSEQVAANSRLLALVSGPPSLLTPAIELELEDFLVVDASRVHRKAELAGAQDEQEVRPWLPYDGIRFINRPEPRTLGDERSLGRIAFCIYRDNLAQALRRRIQCLSERSVTREVRAIVLVSASDGCGSGMLWDVIYLISQQPEVSSIWLILGIEGHQATELQYHQKANVYAVLKEAAFLFRRPSAFHTHCQPDPERSVRSIWPFSRLLLVDARHPHDLAKVPLSLWQQSIGAEVLRIANRETRIIEEPFQSGLGIFGAAVADRWRIPPGSSVQKVATDLGPEDRLEGSPSRPRTTWRLAILEQSSPLVLALQEWTETILGRHIAQTQAPEGGTAELRSLANYLFPPRSPIGSNDSKMVRWIDSSPCVFVRKNVIDRLDQRGELNEVLRGVDLEFFDADPPGWSSLSIAWNSWTKIPLRVFSPRQTPAALIWKALSIGKTTLTSEEMAWRAHALLKIGHAAFNQAIADLNGASLRQNGTLAIPDWSRPSGRDPQPASQDPVQPSESGEGGPSESASQVAAPEPRVPRAVPTAEEIQSRLAARMGQLQRFCGDHRELPVSFCILEVPDGLTGADLEKLERNLVDSINRRSKIFKGDDESCWLYAEVLHRFAGDFPWLSDLFSVYRDDPNRARFHIDRTFFNERDFHEIIDGGSSYRSYCGNPDCTFDIGSVPRDQLECPGCHRRIRTRCGNAACPADLPDVDSIRLALTCGYCGGFNHSSWWECRRHGKVPVILPVDKRICYVCLERHHSDPIEFPADTIGKMPCSQSGLLCPVCRDRQKDDPRYRAFEIPPSLVKAYHCGVNGHELAGFLRNSTILLDSFRCPSCGTALIPVHHRVAVDAQQGTAPNC